jgi:hypothetical protein
MLKVDHEKVKEPFRKYEAAGERADEKKKGITEEVFTAATVLHRSSTTVRCAPPGAAKRSSA